MVIQNLLPPVCDSDTSQPPCTRSARSWCRTALQFRSSRIVPGVLIVSPTPPPVVRMRASLPQSASTASPDEATKPTSGRTLAVPATGQIDPTDRPPVRRKNLRARAASVRRTLLLLVAGSPLLLAVAGRVSGLTQRAKPASDRPGLVFDQYLVNLGEVPVGPQHFAYFSFRNRSDRVVRIKALKPSCGCLSPRLEKREYQPGESGFFFLRVQTANEKPGQKRYECRVLYDDPHPREVVVRFKLVLPERTVTVRPRSLVLYALSDHPIVKDLIVTDSRPHPLTVISAESTLGIVSVEVLPPDPDKSLPRKQRV
ncbi:MAG TPA: DUF1573 domain-containing protein, partial [Planctomycetaceae bacterium]|nr:DUF1573 domain-containing protein [Planctomycetaceae bacterium]